VDDPREPDDLARLQLDGLRERRVLARLHVVADALEVLQGTVLAPHLAGLLGHPPVGRGLAPGHRENESINVLGHLHSPRVSTQAAFTSAPFTIHGVPKRSTTMPKASAQNVLFSGMVTRPPSASASNTRVASATV